MSTRKRQAPVRLHDYVDGSAFDTREAQLTEEEEEEADVEGYCPSPRSASDRTIAPAKPSAPQKARVAKPAKAPAARIAVTVKTDEEHLLEETYALLQEAIDRSKQQAAPQSSTEQLAGPAAAQAASVQEAVQLLAQASGAAFGVPEEGGKEGQLKRPSAKRRHTTNDTRATEEHARPEGAWPEGARGRFDGGASPFDEEEDRVDGAGHLSISSFKRARADEEGSPAASAGQPRQPVDPSGFEDMWD
ncbi:hypothetical protein AB1Y20_019673 [Prymnesium parvum]|uniref:Centrosomal protein of 19 kDa n=1 Tax=Prymnesium parvum TaxID=97485 RepID=A0AB34JV99_PRYPA